MLAWRGRNPWGHKYPWPALQVFYDRKPDTLRTSETEVKNVESIAKGDHKDTLDLNEDGKNIQRIVIHSPSLVEELDSMLGVCTTLIPMV